MKHLVIIGMVVPEPASTAAGHRMMQLIDVFQAMGYHISFLTSSNQSAFSESIEVNSIELNDSSFEEILRNLNPDIVLFDRYITEEQFGWRVSDSCPKALKLLDTEDLHFLRKAREKAFKEKRLFEHADLYNEVFKREISAILRCDLSLIISKYEYELLVKEFKIDESLLFYLPFLNKEVLKDSPKFKNRAHFISIGNFLHDPNWQTVLQLKKIWKDIKKRLPEAEIHIYGGYAQQKVYQLHDEKSGFLIKGRAESVKQVFNKSRILLAPIPFGAGLKGKLWESMLYGLPNITTSIGAEAMYDDVEDWNGYIEDDLSFFVEKAVELYQNEDQWLEFQEKGYDLAQKQFSYDLFFNHFRTRIAALSSSLESHRQQNYLGQILQQNQFNATKYMSKWIEEKNKKGTS